MDDREDDYQENQVVIYREHDSILKVRILENYSNEEKVAYKMRVEEIMNPNSRRKVDVGVEFDCEKPKRQFYAGRWYLEALVENK